MHRSIVNSFILFLTFCFSSLAFSQSETLFSSHEILRLRIEGSWSELLKQRYLSPDIAKLARIPVNVVIINDDKTETAVQAQVGLRGNTSLSPLECAFPKFSLFFSEESVSGTLLAGHEKLAVGSHCSYRGGNSALYGRAYDGKSPLREALVYRLLEILEIPSFKTRPLMVQYIDSSLLQEGVNVGWHQAFVLESLKHFSQRMQYQLVDEEEAHAIDLGQEGKVDMQRLARIVLFNELIENNDWKINLNELPVLRQTWNVFLATNQNNTQIEVIPSDFDLASAVTLLSGNAKTPSETLQKIQTIEVLQAKEFYRSKREALLEEIKSIRKLDPAGYQYIKKKFDLFFNLKIKP